MITIYKFVIDPCGSGIKMPEGAEILSVGFQRDTFCLWAKVDTEAPHEVRHIKAFGTGHDMPHEIGIDLKFIGTGHMDNGMVFHVFEIIAL